jgi:hypothetical protein
VHTNLVRTSGANLNIHQGSKLAEMLFRHKDAQSTLPVRMHPYHAFAALFLVGQ